MNREQYQQKRLARFVKPLASMGLAKKLFPLLPRFPRSQPKLLIRQNLA